MFDLKELLNKIEFTSTKLDCDKTKNSKLPPINNVSFTPQLSIKKNTKFSISDSDVDCLNAFSKATLFEMIVTFIINNSNVMIHGYGSLTKILQQLVEHISSQPTQLTAIHVFNAFSYSIASDFFDDILAHLIKSTKRRVSKDYEEFTGLLQGIKKPILVVVNNIDNKIFLNDEAQKRLSLIAAHSNVIFLATSGSASLEIYWNTEVKDNFSFYNLEFNSYADLQTELIPPQVFVGTSSIKNAVNLENFIKICSEKVSNSFIAIVRHAKETKNSMTFDEISNLLVDSMIVNFQNDANEIINLLVEQQVLVQTNEGCLKLCVNAKGLEKMIAEMNANNEKNN